MQVPANLPLVRCAAADLDGHAAAAAGFRPLGRSLKATEGSVFGSAVRGGALVAARLLPSAARAWAGSVQVTPQPRGSLEGLGLARVASELQLGGVGLYSRDGFVHLDCGPVRRW
jgi:hypothetical protein